MKRLLLALVVVLCASSVDAGEWVRGYIRRDGTYVGGYYRSSPNSSVYDNYGYNPYRSYAPTYRSYYTPTYQNYYPTRPSYYGQPSGYTLPPLGY